MKLEHLERANELRKEITELEKVIKHHNRTLVYLDVLSRNGVKVNFLINTDDPSIRQEILTDLADSDLLFTEKSHHNSYNAINTELDIESQRHFILDKIKQVSKELKRLQEDFDEL